MPQGRSVVGFIGLGDNDGRGMSHMRALPLCAVLATLLYFGQAAAQQPDWPGSKPIRFEVTAAAGGLPDIVPRTLSTFISTSAGVPVIVENRPGAGGNIAAAIVAKAAPDGHALLVTGPNQAVNPTLLPNPGFDYERDLTPVSMVVQTKMLLVASPGFPGNDIADIIRLAKEKPKSLSIAISAIGTPNHLGAEMLTQFGNIDLVFVPYDGISQAIPDLIANRVDLAIAALPSLLPQVKAGALKALAVASKERSPLAPAIPTTAEAGLPALQIDAWLCFMGTGGTPAAIIARLDAEVAKALALPELREAFAKQGIEIFHLNPNELREFLHGEAARLGDLLKHSRVNASSR
jgi:tripartite-type tricarboxylate transporter receptor subunit TctC